MKRDTDPYLRSQYTNNEGQMICQVCKDPLPFKLADGSYYFEAVEFLPEVRKLHYQNYLALCPNHAAMFQFANCSRESMQSLFGELLGNELAVVLAAMETTIYFAKTHVDDQRQ